MKNPVLFYGAIVAAVVALALAVYYIIPRIYHPLTTTPPLASHPPHAVAFLILPGLFGWGDLVRNDSFLPLIVALHLGTSVALVLYFWRDWLQVVRTLITSVKEGEVRTGTEEWVSWLIIIGCIPAGLLGVFLEKPLKVLFASPGVVAAPLVVNGF